MRANAVTTLDIRAAISRGKRLPARVEREVIALGPAAVGPLLDVLRDQRMGAAEQEGSTSASAHAIRLLGAIGDPRAVPELVAALIETHPTEELLLDLSLALVHFDPQLVVDPLLAVVTSTDAEHIHDAAATVLTALGIEDPRILELLIDRLASNAAFGASLLGVYGDAAALPSLHRGFGMLGNGDTAWQEVPEIVAVAAAIADLGGQLSASEQRKLRDAFHTLRSLGRKLRPNEHCWCGSGLKYKRCHDEADRSAGMGV